MKGDLTELLLARQKNGIFIVCHAMSLASNQDYECFPQEYE